MKKKGFTLVELLAVIAILAILVIMALPAVLRMFTQARRDSFTNEVNTVIRTARQKYLLSGGTDTTWSNSEGSGKSLDLTGNSSLRYYVRMNNEGKITKLQVTNGDYQYNVTGIIDVASSSDVEEVTEENQIVMEIVSAIRYVNRQNEGSITIGDEVAIDTEHFYVISSDSTNTVLLAKYNLLVGDVYNSSDTGDGGSTFSFTKTLTSNDPGYGLQSESAKGYYGSTATDRTGVVAFSGKGYWDNKEYKVNGTSVSYNDTAGLKSEYANESNAAGATSYTSPYPYVYNSSMSSVAPSYETFFSEGNACQAAKDNGYTIAYYVEGYVNTLKSLGASNTITGRLLSREEFLSLSSTLKGDWSYWLGSAYNSSCVVNGVGGRIYENYPFWYGFTRGVRPVIVVPTNSMPN